MATRGAASVRPLTFSGRQSQAVELVDQIRMFGLICLAQRIPLALLLSGRRPAARGEPPSAI